MSNNHLDLAAEIVAAYVQKHQIAPDALPALIKNVLASLNEEATPVAEDPPVPAVPIKKSVHDDYIVCLEDGAQLKMLKRYLATRYNMTPEQYRARWGLSPDYPMVAPSYAARRSSVAKEIGLGRKAEREQPAPKPPRRGKPSLAEAA
jgi:predicted transcriptional regulator